MVYYDAIFFILGLAFLASAWLPPRLISKPFSLPMIWLAVGVFIYLVDNNLPNVSPLKSSILTEHVTELALIISLLGAGLKLNRPMGWRRWNDSWRLIGITMPLCIFFMMLVCVYFLKMPFPVALLLGALIAPTDPVLARDVQVGPPNIEEEDEVRFALTSEAGLNDGLTFPFISLALIFTLPTVTSYQLWQWIFIDIFWKIAAGVIAGSVLGYCTAKLILKPIREMSIRDEFIAIALTFLAYGGTQLIHGYGFLGVFIAAYVFRHYEHKHKFHNTLYNFSEQLEQLITPVLLILMAIFICQGLFIWLTWQEFFTSLFFLIIIRPICGFIGLIGSKSLPHHKALVAIFGIRGIGCVDNLRLTH